MPPPKDFGPYEPTNIRFAFTEAQIAAQASDAVYSRGKKYYRDGRAVIAGLRKNYVIVVVRGESGVYRVEFGLTPDLARVKTVACNCPAYSQHPGACKHIVAALLAMSESGADGEDAETYRQPPKPPAPPARRTDPASAQLLRAYTAHIEDEAAAMGAAGTARLVPVIETDYRGTPELGLRVGGKRLYVIQDLNEFHRHFLLRETRSYGKQFALTHTRAAFEPESLPLLDFFLSYYEPESVSAQNRGYRYGGSLRKRYMPLTPPMTDAFLDAMEGQSVLVRDDRNREYTAPVLAEDSPLRFELTRVSGGAELSSPDRPVLLRGLRRMCVLDGDAARVCSPEYTAACAELAAMASGGKSLFFAERDIGALLSAVLERAAPYIKLTKSGDFDAFEPLPLTARVYLDAPESDVVTARAEFLYGEEESTAPAQRDIRGELAVTSLLTAYFGAPEGPLWRMTDDIDALCRLLLEGIARLSEAAEVYASDAFDRVKLRPSPTPSVGVRVDSGLLTVDFSLEGLDLAELPAILASYRAAKKYHRLRDGSVLALGDDALTDLAELAQGLDISDKELAAGHARFAASRAMALDALTGEMRVERDAAFKKIIRDMREAGNADYAVPDALRGVLRGYQKTGYRWLRTLAAHGFGGILADDMGLGKTIQILALLESFRLEGGDRPSVVVCPASLILNWASEARVFTPGLRTCVIAGTAAERAALLDNAADYNLLVTSYDLLKRDAERYDGISFEYAILDEAQYIKNQATKSARSVKSLNARVRLALTGTPIENSLAELWSIFDFLMPDYLYNYNKFRKNYETPIVKNGDADASKRLRRLVSPFLLRRMKKDVLRELPEKTETVLRAPMEGEQRKVYAAHLLRAREDLAQSAGLPPGQDRIAILAALTRLRQVCCDPRLIHADYAGESAKLDLCMELLENCVSSGHRALLFSQFTSMLDIVQSRLAETGVSYLRIDGSTKPSQRLSLVNAFNAGDTPVFLISLKAGGTGLNLTGADVVIHFDPWWNVSAQNQATDRAHRIGQKRAVQVYKLIAGDTIEERILDMQARKAGLADTIVKESEGDPVERLSREELLGLLEVRGT